MIEMLGVLAIIGVLSVGGIAGYSKAMMKFKINKTVDQISMVVANTRTFFASQKKYTGLMNDEAGMKLIKKAHLLPDEMWVGSAGNYHDVENAFGGDFILGAGDKNAKNDDKAFSIELGGVPEEACMELATMDWGSSSSSGLIALSVDYITGVDNALVGCTGQDYGTYAYACPNGSKVSVPMPVSVAAKACRDNVTFNIKFY